MEDKEKDLTEETTTQEAAQPEENTTQQEADSAAESCEETTAPEAEEAAAEQKEETAAEGKKESSRAEKKKKKDKWQEQIEELNDKLLRNRAEFDNYRKRTEKEKQQMYEIGAGSVIEKILPTIDNFERGLAAIPEDEALKSFKDGIDMIYRQFMETLDALGVKPIEAAGQPFDPELHNAVMHVEDESLGENVVAEEFQKGYTYHDKVLRHSMVKVAN